ncbi:MAG: Ser/Thr and Tyr protein phosphatase [Bryobacteraceae bacterium]
MASAAEPLKRRLLVYVAWSIPLTLLFVISYGTTNWLAAQRPQRLHLYADWELGIPFVPWMIGVYLSFNAMMMLPVFVLTVREIHRLAAAFALATLAGSVGHSLLPGQLGWAREAHVSGPFAMLYLLDRPHNLVPSLHVAYSVMGGLIVWRRATSAPLRWGTAGWTCALAASVLLIHQHHLLDVVTGAALGGICAWWFFSRSV